MDKAIQQFKINLSSARQLGVIYQAFVDRVTKAICLDELLRAELVFAVGALDCFIHDLVRIGMAKMFHPGYRKPNAYLNSVVSLGFVERILEATSVADQLTIFEQEIRRVHGHRSFQRADDISQALSLLGLAAVWEEVGTSLGLSPVSVRLQLNLIVDRRNRIVHESDVDPSLGIGEKYPISYPVVSSVVNFVDLVAHRIHAVAKAQIGP